MNVVLRPNAKIVVTFIIAFILTYAAISYAVSRLVHREQLIHKEEAHFIQQEINQKFDLFLDVTLVIGQMSSTFIKNQNIHDGSYGDLVHKILEDKEYILGLNQLDLSGKIINTYPQEANLAALGKTTQHLPQLVNSYNRGEKYWFSPPFKMFQGEVGFGFYIPIKENNQLCGWLASMISSKLFFEHFRSMKFFKTHELSIKDESTGKVYFETAIASSSAEVEEIKSSVWERSIVFRSWPKLTSPPYAISLQLKFLICFLVGLFFAFVTKTYLQKKKAYARLDNISDLLKLTSNEALSKLMDIQTEYLKTGSTGFLSTSVVEKDVQSVTNLIEQIELLQNIAGSEQLNEESFEILPVIAGNSQELQEFMSKKNIDLKLDLDSFKDITITGNKWLVSNTVLKNCLSYCALISRPFGKIRISHSVSPKECSTIFHVENIYEKEVYKALKIERRLLVVRNVMDLLNGKMVVREDGAGGITLQLILTPDRNQEA